MSQLLPKGTLRRFLFEHVDRFLGLLRFGQYRPLSNICGDQLKAGNPCTFCCELCAKLDKIEKDHCLKNAGKP